MAGVAANGWRGNFLSFFSNKFVQQTDLKGLEDILKKYFYQITYRPLLFSKDSNISYEKKPEFWNTLIILVILLECKIISA